MRQGGVNMTNMNLLKSKIIENGLSVERLLKYRNKQSTFYRKLANKGENFTVEEV